MTKYLVYSTVEKTVPVCIVEAVNKKHACSVAKENYTASEGEIYEAVAQSKAKPSDWNLVVSRPTVDLHECYAQ